MAEVARTNSHLVNNLTNVQLYMDRRFQLVVNAPADVAFLREVGPILKFHLCINRSYRQLMDLHGVYWRTHTTSPTTILNHRTVFPVAHAWLYLNQLFSSVVTLIPPAFLSDTVSRIFAYAVEYPRAAVIHLKAELVVVHPIIARRASVQVVDSVMIVDEPTPPPPVHPGVGRAVDSVMIVDNEPEETPVYLPRRPARRLARDLNLKERYSLSASEVDDDNLGDCAVCLEELKIIAGKSWGDILKMPCSHKFHHRCISKWLKMSDSCPLCRAVIP